MFESLTERLNDTFRQLTGRGILTEKNIDDAMQQIRLALLEADVNYQVVKDLIAEIRQECLGEKVLKGVNPGQMTIKIVYDKLVALMGEEAAPLSLPSVPSFIMMVGLHGSGKTTTSGKLARLLQQQNKKKVLLVAADLSRPAAIDQLETLGKQIQVPVYADRTLRHPLQLALNAQQMAQQGRYDVVILDTAGRLQIDQSLVQELVEIRNILKPSEILLVADAALGQEAVSVAEHFDRALNITGIILTKLDGDARGGAAISMRKVTGKPIKFIGVGEKLDDLQPFYPRRMADRILGMGDVVSLVESIQQKVDEEEAAKIEEKLKRNQIDFNDFLKQIQLLKGLGGFSKILDFIPGGSGLLKKMNIDERHLSRIEAIILSMTPKERANPDLLREPSRQRRIAKGAGVPLEAVNFALTNFNQAKKVLGNFARSGALANEEVGIPSSLTGYNREPKNIALLREQRKRERQERKKQRQAARKKKKKK